MKVTVLRLLQILLVILAIGSANQWLRVQIGGVTFWWIVQATILLATLRLCSSNGITLKKYMDRPVKLYLFWCLISVFRGFFVAENYWEWKNLVGTGLMMCMPIITLLIQNPSICQKLIGYWVRYALPLFLAITPLILYSDAPGRFLAPVVIFLLFFSALPFRWKVIIGFFSILVILAGLDARSNVIRIVVSLSFGLLFYMRKFAPTFVYRFLHACFIALPFAGFLLAFSGVFNVFNAGEYLGNTDSFSATIYRDGEIQEESLMADTRTFIYNETIHSAIKNDYFLTGRTPARGYDSEWFGSFNAEELGTKKYERFASEVSVLNVFTWTGLIGMVLYFLIFLSASAKAVYRSNNIYIKIVGIFVAFRWLYAWVEDFSNFDLNYLFLWILIGMCNSIYFRSMNNQQFKEWIIGIFEYSRRKFRVPQLVVHA